MNLLIGLLTILLVINSLLLLLLVLIQLPKKEAGIGVAFGGSATDALFGAGTGTVLTKATRYGTTTFHALRNYYLSPAVHRALHPLRALSPLFARKSALRANRS